MTNTLVYFIIAVITAVSAVYVRQIRPDFALLVTLSGTLLLMSGIIPRIVILVSEIKAFCENGAISGEYIVSVMKIIGITYLAEFSSDICIDAGERSLANHVQTFGKITVAFIAFPIIEDVFALIRNLLE